MATQLERVTLNFIERASRAIRLSMRLTGLSRTDVLNRDAQLGAYIDWQVSRGARFFVQEPGTSTKAEVLFSPRLPGEEEEADEVARALASLDTAGDPPHR